MSKKKTKLDNMMQTHGKIEDIQYKTLDQIWGDNVNSKYQSSNEKEYIIFLNDMNKTDLQAHANKIGLVPIDNRETLTKRLVAEFKKHASLFNIPKSKDNTVNLNKKAKDTLSEGK
jgi:hypothetical protein